MSVSTPDWVKDAVFYQIFPDRFACSDRVAKPSNLEPWDAPPTKRGFKGGDLLGIVERFDHLSELGVNALYLNPVFQSTANHRYHTHDYHQVDPILGGDEAVRALLDEAHRRGVRVILDGVFNHASRGLFQFNHILENGPSSPYLDWFHIEEWPLRPYDISQPANYGSWWGIRELPKFNTNTPAVREFLWGVARRWIDDGIDGWRLDVPADIDDPPFWREFRRRVRAGNPAAYLVGEIWHQAADWLAGDRFDALMNYPISRACLGFMGGDDLDVGERPGGYELRRLSVEEFADQVEATLTWYDWEVVQVQMNVLDSHDMSRFLGLAGGRADRLKLAVLFQMTFPGAPCIYYGDEIGLAGRGDPGCREGFPWDSDRWDQDLLAFYRRAVRLRHDHPALRRGRLTRVYAGDGVYAYLRHLDGEVLLIALNGATDPRVVDLRLPAEFLAPDAVLRDLWGGEELPAEAGVLRGVRLEPLSGRVFRRR
jgi:cyclomaltodextrinase / maltogenic alpha-amylase / neopullulanase